MSRITIITIWVLSLLLPACGESSSSSSSKGWTETDTNSDSQTTDSVDTTEQGGDTAVQTDTHSGSDSQTLGEDDTETQNSSDSDTETNTAIDTIDTGSDSTTESTDEPATDTETGSETAPSSDGYRLGHFIVHWDEELPMQIRVTHESEPKRVIWETSADQSFVNARLVNTTFSESHGSFKISDDVKKKCTEHTPPELTVEADKLTFFAIFGDCNVSFTLSFKAKTNGQLGFDLIVTPDAPPADPNARWRAVLRYATTPDEGFYGFGEQFTYLNIKGRVLPIISQEQGHGRGLEPLTTLLNTLGGGAGGAWHTTYAPAPHYVTNTTRSLFLENYEYSIFDLSAPDVVDVAVHTPHMVGRIVYGATPLDLIEEYTSFAGRMPPLPRWIGEGAILGLMGGSDVVRARVKTLQDHGTPISVLWTQDWVGQRKTLLGSARLWWNWEVDRTVYPDWEQLIADMNDQGIRMMAYINPFLTDTSGNPNHETNLYADAKELGYLVEQEDGQPVMIDSGGFSGAMVDFSNPEAREWFKGIMQAQLIDKGLSGWMGDFGEAIPFDAAPFFGESPQTYHNHYPEEWAEINREIVEENGLEGEVVPFLRSGFTRSPRYSQLFWLGDQLTSWDEFDGIKTALTGLLSSGLSGFSLNHSDIGGLIEMSYWPIVEYKRSKELLQRWIELNAFTPIFRNHEGNNPDSGGHQIYSDSDTMDFFARFAKVFAALNDYRMSLMPDVAEKGYPIVRHPFLHYPDDPAVWNLEYQFMLGPDFMIAPVLDEGATTVEVYLPIGSWVHAFTGTTYTRTNSGGWITVDAPIGTPAVFYKEGSPWGEDFAAKLKDQGIAP